MDGWIADGAAIVANGISILTVILIMQLFFGARNCRKWWHYLILTGIAIVWNTVCVLIFREADNWQFAGMLVLIAAAGIGMAEKQRWRSGLEGILACLIYGWYGMFAQMLEKLFGLESYAVIIGGEAQSYLEIALYAVLPVGLFLAIRQTTGKGISLRLTVPEELILLLMVLLSPLYGQVLTYIDDNFGHGFYSFAWGIFVLVLNIGVFVGIIDRKLAKHYREISENYRESFHTEYQYFKDYKKNQSELVRFRHDWKNHMLTLQGLLEQGDYVQAQDYFRQLSEQSGISGKQILTGNEIADILLNAKADWMQQNAIELDIQGSLYALKNLEIADCSILISNLIDNAIEANLACDSSRYIRIRAAEMPGMLMLTVANRMAGELKQDDGHLLTSKKDRKNHGIGTKNIRHVVEKYHGEYRIQIQDGQFQTQILLPLKDEA